MTLIRNDLVKKPEHRKKLLKTVYILAEGNPNTFVELIEVVDKASMNAEGGLAYGQELAGYWIDKDFLHTPGNKRTTRKVRITAQGIDFIEPEVLKELT